MPTTHDSHLAKLEHVAQQDGGPVDPVDVALPEPFVAIPVRDEAPALAVARCVNLGSANPVRLLLPQDPRRRRAVVLAIDNDVYVASSLELAQAVEGAATGSDAFYLSKGVPLPVTTKAALWVACTTTGSASRVSVLVEKDDE